MNKVFNDLISIIVPVYNVQNYLEECIDSIVNQTYKNLEIILIDDGSLDDSGKICDDYAKKDTRIRVIHKKNGGLSDARNTGISLAKGSYIGFVDSDDWIHKDMFNDLYNNLITYKADISACNLLRVTDKTKIMVPKQYDSTIRVFTKDEYMKKFFKINTQECVYYAVIKLYKKSLLTNDQYPIGLTSEDVVGTYKALANSDVIVEINYPYYYYRNNPKSITANFSESDFDLLKIWDSIVKLSSNTKNGEWAILNRNRIDYTLLMRMAMEFNYKDIEKKYKKEKDLLLMNLKNNKKKLLKSSIPVSRKLTIILIILDYKHFCYICKFIRRMR